jgi:hypothetical protein
MAKKITPNKLHAVIIAAMSVINYSACSKQTSESDTPFPISPRTAFEEAIQNQPSTQSSQKTAASPVGVVQIPTVHCIVTATRTDQDATTTKKSGAIVTLDNEGAVPDTFLVYRVPATSRTPGSFLMVDDMVFGDEGTHGSGTYPFELQFADGRSCFVTITITSDDTADKHLIKVKASFPE